ncbi:MAG: hypothetical protein GQ539_02270 [Sulfitobacter sp.]|nr:hypothetical protein [Sulfitobacter sp.]
MSHRANHWLAQISPERVKPGAFRVLFHLCDHHNGERDPRRACFPSQETLRKRTGMANGTLNSALKQLETDGLIHRIRSTVPGQTTRRTYYVLECDFESIDQQTLKSGFCPNSTEAELDRELAPESHQANSGFKAGKLRHTGDEPVTNLQKKKVCSADAAQHTHSAFQEFWKVFPRARSREASAKAFAEAVASGADPAAIIAGAKAYEEENKDNVQQFLAFSENWLKKRRWKDYEISANAPVSTAEMANYYASRINAHKSIFGQTLNEEMRAELISKHGLTVEQIDAAVAT